MSACGKIKFQSRSEANAHARYASKHGKKAAPNMRAYLCPLCDFWHLTSRSKVEQRRVHRRNVRRRAL